MALSTISIVFVSRERGGSCDVLIDRVSFSSSVEAAFFSIYSYWLSCMSQHCSNVERGSGGGEELFPTCNTNHEALPREDADDSFCEQKPRLD